MGSPKLREHELAEIMARYKKARRTLGIKDSCNRVSELMGIKPDTIYGVVRRLAPTTDIATDYIRGSALKLAMRVVRKANADQSIALLRNPRIGVLDPESAGGGGGGRMFMVGVAMDSLGGVKVGVQIGPTTDEALGLPAAISEAEVDEESILEGATTENEEDEAPVVRRKWHEKDPPKAQIAPIPKEPGEVMGSGLEYRLAQAKRIRKELASKKRKDAADIRDRMKRMQAEMGKV